MEQKTCGQDVLTSVALFYIWNMKKETNKQQLKVWAFYIVEFLLIFLFQQEDI